MLLGSQSIGNNSKYDTMYVLLLVIFYFNLNNNILLHIFMALVIHRQFSHKVLLISYSSFQGAYVFHLLLMLL